MPCYLLPTFLLKFDFSQLILCLASVVQSVLLYSVVFLPYRPASRYSGKRIKRKNNCTKITSSSRSLSCIILPVQVLLLNIFFILAHSSTTFLIGARLGNFVGGARSGAHSNREWQPYRLNLRESRLYLYTAVWGTSLVQVRLSTDDIG